MNSCTRNHDQRSELTHDCSALLLFHLNKINDLKIQMVIEATCQATSYPMVS